MKPSSFCSCATPTAACMSVSFQVVADVRVGVLVVVAAGQIAQLPVEALAAGVVLAGLAPAVAAPVAERFDQRAQQRLVRQHRAAFAHGDVVRGVEADGRQIAERADLSALDRVDPTASQQSSISHRSCVRANARDRGEIERIAQRVREDHGARARRKRGFELRDIDVVGGNGDVDEHRDQAVLDDRIDRGGKAGGDA